MYEICKKKLLKILFKRKMNLEFIEYLKFNIKHYLYKIIIK
jgi:hypothetical protein